MDRPVMWQNGINVDPEVKAKGIGKMFVTLLKNEILGMNRLPYINYCKNKGGIKHD